MATWSRWPDRQVIAIRADCRVHKVIAQEYGVSREAISQIKRRIRWRHVA